LNIVTSIMNSSEMETDSELDLLQLDFASRKIDDLVHGLVTLDVPSWYINPVFKTLFSDRSNYDSVAASSPLTMAPRMDDVLSEADPPSLNFFLSLPEEPEGKHWGVYALTMEKDGCDPCVYIGSGTNADLGVRARMRSYAPGRSGLPRFVQLRFGQGYHVSHIGLLCYTPLPSPGLAPRVQARILLVEATMTVTFHAAYAAVTDSWFSDLLFWPREKVLWKPLCSHLPFKEAVRGNLDLSPEELEIIAALRTSRLAERALEGSRRHRARKTQEDPVGYLQKCSASKQEWWDKNRERVNKTAGRVRAKAIEQNRFRCEDCDLPFQSKLALESHLQTKAHEDRAAGIAKSAPTVSAVAVAMVRARAKAEQTHHCSTCDKSFENDWSLTRHLATALHAKRLRKSLESQSS
jgi:hypothetical protein